MLTADSFVNILEGVIIFSFSFLKSIFSSLYMGINTSSFYALIYKYFIVI